METDPGAARARVPAALLAVGLLLACAESETPTQGLQRFPTGMEASSVRIGTASRWANLHRLGETVRTTLVLPPSAHLTVPWAVTEPHDSARIEIDVLDGNEQRSLLRQDRSRLDSRDWYEEQLDLSDERPGPIELQIRFHATGKDLAKGYVALAPLEVWSANSRAIDAASADVILIAIDTLRADRLSTYGADRPTPNIDALGASGTIFENAFSPSTWTLPSFASVFTSTYPQRHRVASKTAKLPLNLTTLGEIFARHGYRTIGLFDKGWINPRTGINRGFDQYVAGKGFGDFEQRLSPRLENADNAPLLLFFHTYDVHQPYYSSPKEYQKLYTDSSYESPFRLRKKKIPSKQGRVTAQLAEPDIQLVSDLYDGEVRFVDDSLQIIFDLLDRHRPNRPRLVVLFSDHGESFGESGRMLHDSGPYRELSHVPLIIAGSGIPAGRRVEEVVQLLDLLPTLIDLLGLSDEAPGDFDGSSFAHLLHPERAETKAQPYAVAQRGARWAVRTSDWSLVRDPRSAHLYDRRTDPRELVDVAAEHPEVVERLEAFYQELVDSGSVETPGEVALDDATLDELRALGYLN